MPFVIGTIREFRTANFRVIVDAIEDHDMDLSWDDDGEVLDKLERGIYLGFCARFRVIHDDLGEVAANYLGGCIYERLEDFEDHREAAATTRKLRAAGDNTIVGSYFACMLSETIAMARKELIRLRDGLAGLHIRAA